MKRPIALILAAALSTFVLACKNEQRVQAGGEENQPGQAQTSQPLPGPTTGTTSATAQDIQGELRSVNTSNMTFIVRTDNGMEQTFRYDDDTSVSGIPSVATTPSTDREKSSQATQVGSLIGKEGSEVTVHWTQDGADKVATSIDVSQMATRPARKKY